MTHVPSVLVIGLDPRRVPGPWDPQPVLDALAEGAQRFVERDIAMTECLVGLDGSDDVAAVVSDALREASWDVVVIGGGLRDPQEQDLLLLFEQVVNLVHRHAPQAAIAFNSRPDDCADAASRWLA